MNESTFTTISRPNCTLKINSPNGQPFATFKEKGEKLSTDEGLHHLQLSIEGTNLPEGIDAAVVATPRTTNSNDFSLYAADIIRKLKPEWYFIHDFNPDWNLVQVEVNALNVALRYYNKQFQEIGTILLSTEMLPPNNSSLDLLLLTPYDVTEGQDWTYGTFHISMQRDHSPTNNHPLITTVRTLYHPPILPPIENSHQQFKTFTFSSAHLNQVNISINK